MKSEIYKQEGYAFMAAAFEVYNDRGYGMAEEITKNALNSRGKNSVSSVVSCKK